METPPVLEPNPSDGLPPAPSANLAQAGLYLSLVAPLVVLAMVLIQPG